ncbi:MAG TPA: M13 family metallopeptidase [Thermoanaerobaculia bacterium]|jgi:predicted metalloendopeptidase|nr:M13 family metallopeptidase [Thermoanaerobaculia bacterium]
MPISRTCRLPLAAALFATTLASLPATAASPAAAAKPAKAGYDAVAAEIRATIDPKADPCQSFYQYACGGWLAKTTLPADESQFGRGFSQLADTNREVLHDVLEGLAKKPGTDPDNQKLGAFYASCMDEGVIEKAGAAPLAPLFAEIAKVSDVASALTIAGKLQREGVEALLSTFVEADFKDPDLSIAYLTQGGLGLPDRDYYLKDDADSKKLLADYQTHVAKMLGLAGESAEDAARHAAGIVVLETALAKASLPRAEMRDPNKLYHRVDPAALAAMSGGLSLAPFFAGLGQPDLSLISASPEGFFQGLAEALKTTDMDILRADFRWLAIHARADQLSQAFVDEDFAFFDKQLQGQQELQVRWKRCVEATDGALGFALGRAFVERQFAGESKKVAVEMIQDIEHSFEAGLPQLAWMDDTTRARAKEKADVVFNKIGYPDKWRDYSAMTVTPGASYFANSDAAIRFEVNRLLGKIGQKVDRTEWGMTPPTVNAYYNPLRNEMVFPAGVLQPPFFSKDHPAPMNYGGIGMAMGHELTHGFDDQGRQFDGSGRLREWWDPAVVTRFQERTQCVENLYSGFEVEPGVKINGKLTLGENIADFGGIKASFHGLHSWAERNGNPGPLVPGFTNDQLFFLGFAQSWCSIRRPEFSKMLATVDPHSPPNFRVDGPLSNFPAFAETFKCAEGTPMNRAQRCEVW